MTHDNTLWKNYVEDVLSGKQTAGKYIIALVKNFAAEVTSGVPVDDRWSFDTEQAERYIDFIQTYTRHTRGSWAGKPFILSPWQQFLITNLFGWVDADGARRYRTAYVYVGRKSGKSQLAAGIAMAMATLDGDGAGEYVFAATTRAQARIVFDEVQRSIRKAPEVLRKRFTVRRQDVWGPNDSVIKPVSSDANTLDGLSLNLGVVDEYHAHTNSNLLNVLKSSMGSRKSPLLLAITTAGFIADGPCALSMRTGKEVILGQKTDNRTFYMIYQLDDPEEWEDESAWVKANPGLDTSITYDYLRSQQVQARNMGPMAVAEWKTKHGNLFQQSADIWIEPDRWAALARPEKADLITPETPLYVGLDLAKASDVSCAALLYDLGDEGLYLTVRHWLPSEAVKRALSKSETHVYATLEDNPNAEVQPDSNVTDYARIREFISGVALRNGQLVDTGEGLATKHNLENVVYDAWNSSQLVMELEGYDGVPCVPLRQGTVSLNTPTREIEERILEGNLYHDGDPFLAWMLGNVVLEVNANGYIRPNKAKSADKIDGVAAAVNAMAGYIVAQEAPEPEDVIPEDWAPRWV